MTLNHTNALTFERSFMLKFLLHVVGDIHQPLHSASRITREQLRGDRGGNSFLIKYSGEISNLHSLWDSGMGKLATKFRLPLSA